MRKFGALLAVNLKAMLTSFRFGGGRKGRQKAAPSDPPKHLG